MRSLVDDGVFDTGNTVKDDSSATTSDIVDGLAGKEEASGGGYRHAVHPVEGPCSGGHFSRIVEYLLLRLYCSCRYFIGLSM